VIDAAASPPVTRPPFVYFGGKQRIADAIVRLLPAHTHYVEPFAGSLAVLLAKPPSRLETVNDLDQDLMLFWKVLRERPDDLAKACARTPHSRAERALALKREAGLPELERARRVWVCLTQGRAGTLRNTGWRHDTADDAHSSMPTRLAGYLARLDDVATRISAVSLECRPAHDVIAAYGRGRRTLLYVDPPYLGSVRERNYRHELRSEDQHRELAEVLHRCAATVVLSGYASDLYDRELYAGWYRRELTASTSQGGAWEPRTEVLWSNRPFAEPAGDDTEPDLASAPGFRNIEPTVDTGCNETRCAATDCAKVLTQTATGRPRRYCSTACRVRAHRRTQAQAST
jgi:DNA adenine methylase